MARNFRRIFTGIQLVGQASITPDTAGEFRYNSSTNKIQFYDGTAARYLVSDTGTETLTNKTLTGNTAANLISGSGTLVLNTTGTATIPNATDTLVGKATTDILTNKTFDADGTGNSISNIENADIKASAAIERSKIASGSNDHVVINGAAGALSSEASLAITRGGTGQATANAGFNALSPNTTKGDITVFSTVNARLPVGSNNQVLTVDSAQTLGVKWATPSAEKDGSGDITNLSLAASISSNILTIDLKTKAGTDPSASDIVKIGFRNATATTGTYSIVEATAANSLTIGTAVSLGLLSATSNTIYIYALNNAGTLELFASAYSGWDQGRVQSTSTTGTSNAVLYGANARSNMAIRLIGRVKATWTTAVGWSSLTNIDLVPFVDGNINCLYESNTARSISNNAATTGEFLMEDRVFDTHNAYSTTTAIFTVPADGKYRAGAMVELASSGNWDRNEQLTLTLYKNGTYQRSFGTAYGEVTNTLIMATQGATLVSCVAGDTLEIRILQNSGGAISTSADAGKNWISYERIGI